MRIFDLSMKETAGIKGNITSIMMEKTVDIEKGHASAVKLSAVVWTLERPCTLGPDAATLPLKEAIKGNPERRYR